MKRKRSFILFPLFVIIFVAVLFINIGMNRGKDKLELLEYINLSEETVESIENEDRKIRISRDDSLSRYKGELGNSTFWLSFDNNEVASISLFFNTEMKKQKISLAGWFDTMSLQELEKIYSEDLKSSIGENRASTYASLRMEKMGVLQLETGLSGNGDLNVVIAKTDHKKIEQLKNFEYIWREKEIDYENSSKNVNIKIKYPEIEVVEKLNLTNNLNKFIVDGICSKLAEYNLRLEEISSWENTSIEIDYEMTFESAECISFCYTGKLKTQFEEYPLIFGTTCSTMNNGELMGFGDFINLTLFGQHEDYGQEYDIIYNDDKAFYHFQKHEGHFTEFYLKPACVVYVGKQQPKSESQENYGRVFKYDTEQLLRNGKVWMWGKMQFVNSENNVNVSIMVPKLLTDLHFGLEKENNEEIEKVISDQLNNYGLDIDEINNWSNVQISLGCVCKGDEAQYDAYQWDGTIIINEKEFDISFEYDRIF